MFIENERFVSCFKIKIIKINFIRNLLNPIISLMKKILLTLSIIVVVFTSQYVPIPKRELGILIGKADADVKIDLIYDPVCDGSANFEGIFQ